MRSICALVVIASLFSPVTSGAIPDGQSGGCAVTAPNQSPLPDIVRSRAAVPATDAFRHGNGQIWTSLWPEGNVVLTKKVHPGLCSQTDRSR